MSNERHGKGLATTAALFSMVVFAVTANVIPAALIRMAKAFEIDVTLLANISAFQFLGFISATIVGGVVSDYFGKKVIFLLASALTIAGSILCGLADWLAVAYAGCLLMGLGGGVLEGQSSALLADLYPTRRKLMLNISQAAYCVGAIGGPALMGLSLPLGVSWRWFFFMISLMAMALLILYWQSWIPGRAHEDRIKFSILKGIVGEWDFICPCLILFLYVLVETTIVVFMNPYLFLHRHAPESWAIYGISIFWGTMTIGRVLCAAIPERVSTPNVVFALMTLTACSLVGQYWADSWKTAVVLFALSGFFCAGAWPLIIEISAARYPKFTGSVLGITVAAGAVGCVVAPPLGGVLFERAPAAAVFPIMSAFMFLGAILVWTETARREES